MAEQGNIDASSPTPIAIVGVACRFPADASTPENLWNVLSNGKSAWREFPADRLNINGFYHPSVRSDSFNFRGAHFIDEDVAAFDAKFFGVAQAEADAIDPQQRILLEVSYEAVENAGFPMETFQGSNTCVFIGSFVKDYEQISMRDSQTTAPDCATGNGIAIMANRISYFFDLQGTSQTIDTGCSASLVSVHQAVNALRAGQSDIGIAGGAGLILTPSTIMPMTSLGFLSEDGKCFTFDSRANGYGRGEGVGIVVLKRLEDAIRDNDTIRAVIRGTASNQDGHTPGITVPNPEAQVRCIGAAYRDAGLGVDETAYVECHGTGTKVGDWRELRAISTALCANRPSDKPMYVGSVKPNIGHLEGAAGVAGLIKAILIAEKGQIPPHINFREWNPDIKHDEWGVEIAKDLMKFPADGLRRISVNCFGFGGTNAHGILDDARTFLKQRGLLANHNTTDPAEQQSSGSSSASDINSLGDSWDLASQSSCLSADSDVLSRLFVFSAQHRDGVPRLARSHIPYLDSKPDSLRDYSYTLYSRRSRLDFRTFVIAKSASELTQKMAAITASDVVRPGLTKEFRPALIFCGQGAQWARNGMELMTFPVFSSSITAATAYMQTLDKDFSLKDKLLQPKDSSEINLPGVAQPATTAIQIALVDLLTAMGIDSVAVAGHSSGEIAAAYAAGILTREDAWKLAFHRGQCAAAVKILDPSLRGRMLAVGSSRSDVQTYLANIRPDSVAVACINSPQLITLSGDEDSILAIKAELDANHVFNALVVVETAYHSHHMKVVAQQYMDSIRDITPREGKKGVKMFSAVTGEQVSGQELDAEYWTRNMVCPVEFDKAVGRLVVEAMPNAFVEVSPHRVWGKALGQILEGVGVEKGLPYFAMLERGRDAVECVLGVVGEMWLRGEAVGMEWCFRSNDTGRLPKCLVDLPTYPWDHEKSYWHESHLSRAHRFRQFGRRDYIGAPTSDGVMPYEPRWRGFFRVPENPWLHDHKVQNEILYPAAGMVVMAIEAAGQVVYDVVNTPADVLDYEVSKFEIKAPMVVPADEDGLEHCMNAKRIEETTRDGLTTWVYEFAIYSKPYGDAPFQENAKGEFTVRFYRRGAERRGERGLLVKEFDEKWKVEVEKGERGVSAFEFYEGLDVVGMNYGPLFRNIIEMGQTRSVGTQKECWASIAIPDTKGKMPKKFEFDHVIHPATLDAVFQTFFTLGSNPMVPFFIDSVKVAAHIPGGAGTTFSGVAMGASVGLKQASASIDMWHRGAEVDRHVIQVSGLRAMSLASMATGGVGFLPSHRSLSSHVVWKEDLRYAEFADLGKWLDILGHKNPGASILHLGEDGRITSTVFRVLAKGEDGAPVGTPRLGRYTMGAESDKGYENVLKATAEKHQPLLTYSTLESLVGKEAWPHQFNLVMVEDTASVTGDALEKLVGPAGFVLTVSASAQQHPVASFRFLESVSEAVRVNEIGLVQLFRKKRDVTRSRRGHEIIILTPDLTSPSQTYPIATILREDLEKSGLGTRVEPLSWLEDTNHDISNAFVVSLIELYEENGFVFNMNERQYELVKTALRTSKALIWVTRAGQMGGDAPWNAAFLGWARTVRSEDSQKEITCLDLDSADDAQNSAALIQRILFDTTIAPSVDDGGNASDTEFAEVDGKVYIPRLAPLEDVNAIIEHGREKGLQLVTGPAKGAEGSMKLEVGTPGNFGSLYFAEDELASVQLGRDQVRISVKKAFLFPADLDTALGRNTRTAIGIDVVGTVVEVGSNVEGFKVRQEVAALCPEGAVRGLVVVQEGCVQALPEDGPSEDVVPWSVLAVYAAYRAAQGLMETGRARSFLVHDAAGPHGMAALAVFQHLGAKVIAVVSSEQQREFVKGCFGISDDSIILDGPSLVEGVRRVAGNGSTVDLVFDPAPDARHMDASFTLVASHGRVFQIVAGPTSWDGIHLPPRSFEFVRFDIQGYLKMGLALDSKFSEVYKSVSVETPLMRQFCHLHTFGQAGEALKLMERDLALGTHALELRDEEDVVFGYNPLKHTADLDPNGIYVIVGGFGGLGLGIAEWMVEQGAGHIVLLSRSAAPAGKTLTGRYEKLRQSPRVKIYTYQLDICVAVEVSVFASWLETTGLKLRGVIHAAGALRDFTYQNMTFPDWTLASRVKTLGSYNLHRLLPQSHLHFFLFLSSAAGVIGNRGQSNYAAGNAFQDALARYRSARGQRTISLDLGPIIGAGMVDQEMMDLLRSVGYFGIRLADMLFMVERAIAGFATGDKPLPPQVVMGVGTGGLIRQTRPADPFWAETALFAHLNRVDVGGLLDSELGGSGGSTDNGQNLQPRLKMAQTMEEGVEIILGPLIAAMVSIIPNLDASDIESSMTPTECNSDSMRGTNIDNWLKRTTGVSIGQAINSMPLQKICEEVVKRGGFLNG
ncbi:ketoacyl-synt-domain-containing protein [Podospora aff. communis PSN243]|uniref:Ketoacyl-synt-domain-containing protein n=1 Tax=Podospora aff. communis PSN243 TaxID=3040156 RepID=A0AAV9H3A4_9PEZI|nr:ketoacyl-synt-domain-containing protein [Podospora aff. communis PSN243]